MSRRVLVLISGLAIQLCVGILYMWSVFQPYIVAFHGWSSAHVAMTSSIMITMFVFGNILGGFFQERIHPRYISLAGGVLFCLGLLLTSVLSSEQPWMIYLTYGVLSGTGTGLAYGTVLSVLQKWYAAKSGFITGLCVSFFGLSLVILSPITEALLGSGGVPVTFQVLGAVLGGITIGASFFICKPSKEYYRAEAVKAIPLENIKQFTPGMMLKSASFYYIAIGLFLSSAAYMIIVPYIKVIAIDKGMSNNIAIFAVMLTGASNAIGRLAMPALSDKLGRSRCNQICVIISALACLLLLSDSGILYILSIFLIAFSYGGTSGINPAIVAELFGVRHSGVNYGLTLVSLAASSVFFGQISSVLSSGTSIDSNVFIMCAILCGIPFVAMYLLKKRCLRLGKVI